MKVLIFSSTLVFMFSSSLGYAQLKLNKPPIEKQEQQFLDAVINDGIKDSPVSEDFSNRASDGLNHKDISPVCDPKTFENTILSENISGQDYFKSLNEYFIKCEGELTDRSPKGIWALLKWSRYDYSFLKHPQIQLMSVKLDSGISVPAVMALKLDKKPRPLIIVKCGTFCAAEEGPSMKAYMMSLFDQSPFNVVFLASQTGLDYLKINHVLSLGGWSEGEEAFEVGRWFKEKWEYKDRISSVHLVGLSLGGNAAVFGATFNDFYESQDGKKVFSSVTAVCPVIDLMPTLDSLYGSIGIGSIFAKLTKDQFTSVREALYDIPDLLADSQIPKSRKDMTKFLGNIASTSLQRRGIDSSLSSFFESNSFFNITSEVKTPLLLWASKNDIIVSNEINTLKLERSKLHDQSFRFGILNLKEGSHCAFHGAYGPLAASTVLRTFILSNSPEYLNRNKKYSKPWSFGFKKLNSSEVHVGQTFEFLEQSASLKVLFKIFNRDSSYCKKMGPWSGQGSCISNVFYNLPIEQFKALGARIPKNSVEAESLSREFNTKIEFQTKDLKNLNGTGDSEFLISWRDGLE
jgi:hypothetical protein